VAVTLASVDGTFSGSAANPIYYDAGELRRADAALVSTAGITTGLSVSVDGSDVVTVTAGQVIISGEDAVTGTGVYRAGIAASATGSLEARDATNGRIDLVVFRQYDTDVVASHPRRASEIEVITGTPSATPGVPTKPSMAVELARITVPKYGGGAATVDASHRTYARAAGSGVDTGWQYIDNNTIAPGALRYRRRGDVVEVQINGTATTTSGTTYTVTLTQIPAEFCPSANTRGPCAFSGFPGSMMVQPDGNVLVQQNSGANRGDVSGNATYLVE
jgi:hypothetical protein